jgi:drug/metabolite transporter (DMT)-like permease
MTWLLFALLGPTLWAFGNVLDGALRRKFIPDDLTLTWVMSALRMPIALGLLFFTQVFSAGFWPFIILLISGFLLTMPFWFYYKALKKEDVSRIVVLIQIVPIFTLVIGHFVLNEQLTGIQGIAFLLLLSAGICAALKPTKKKLKLSSALLLMILATFLWAISDVLFKAYSASYGSFWDAYTAYLLGGSLTVFVLYKPMRRTAPKKIFRTLSFRGWVYVLLSYAFGTLGTVAFTYALTLGKVSLTSVMMGVQPLVALVIGVVLAPLLPELVKEDLSKKSLILKAISFVLVIAGLAVLQI